MTPVMQELYNQAIGMWVIFAIVVFIFGIWYFANQWRRK